jgi:hypothetical protein
MPRGKRAQLRAVRGHKRFVGADDGEAGAKSGGDQRACRFDAAKSFDDDIQILTEHALQTIHEGNRRTAARLEEIADERAHRLDLDAGGAEAIALASRDRRDSLTDAAVAQE